MKITVEFDTWEEMEAFRASGKRTRSKKEEAEETVTEPAPVQAQQAAAVNPIPAQSFAPPAAQAAATGFPGANGPTPPAPSKVVAAIMARIDGAINSGQSTDAIVNWFRQQIGPEAANASLEQIRNILVPRLTQTQLDQIVPQLGIQVQ